jgi:phosphoglycolate phosphatase/pyrophosphatase PpaX
MARLRPDQDPVSLEGWYRKNFHPGIVAFLTRELGFTKEEMRVEYRMWQECNRRETPLFFDGFLDVLERFRARGGLVTVVSHSEVANIRRHYEAGGFVPDLILGWDDDATRRKPSPWPVQTILSDLDVQPSEALVLDDLKPGVQMARSSGVSVAAAGWGHDIPEIRSYMRNACDVFLPTVSAFGEYVDRARLR